MTDGATPPPPPRQPARRDAAFAAALVVVLTISIQTGSALAVRVIDSVGVFEALWLRTAFAALHPAHRRGRARSGGCRPRVTACRSRRSR